MVDINLSGSQFVEVCDHYIKDSIEQCFTQEAIYKSCISNGRLELIMYVFAGLLLLFVLLDIYRTFRSKKANPPKQTGVFPQP